MSWYIFFSEFLFRAHVTTDKEGDGRIVYGPCLYIHQETCHLLFWTRTSEKVEKSTRNLESKKS